MTIIAVLATLGVVLILAELILPGGILGLGGALCLLSAVGFTFSHFGPLAGAASLLGVLVFGFFTLSVWMKFFRRLPVTSRLVLRKAIDDRGVQLSASLIGKEGVALTRLAPSGHAEVDGEKLDVMSQGGVIDKGCPIRIVDSRGPSLFVEKA